MPWEIRDVSPGKFGSIYPPEVSPGKLGMISIKNYLVFFRGDQTMEIEHEFPENNSALFGLVIQFILSLVGLLPSDHLQVLCRRVDTMHSSTDVISTGLTQDTFS